MKRSIILVLDSLGLGSSADAHLYGDEGADTFGHIVEACAKGDADSNLRSGALKIPNLLRWGLGAAANLCRNQELPLNNNNPEGAFGYACELSVGKDTPSGHWEICGLPVPFEWGTFPNQDNCFPDSLLNNLIKKGRIDGTLANKHASGTEVIREFGELHLETGQPICYTSADSVFQIAAHEETFGLERLYELCKVAKDLVDDLNITRVIARPFIGSCNSDFKRTSNRRDLTTPPNGLTLLDYINKAGGQVVSLGKIADIFSSQGVTYSVKGSNNMDLIDQLLIQMHEVKEGLIFVNLNDFDTLYGHRRDVSGYAYALEQLDARMIDIENQLDNDDLVLITADHGCDPTWPGSDHTREHVPVVFYGNKVKNNNLGERKSFADMGQTIATHLGINRLPFGDSCQLI